MKDEEVVFQARTLHKRPDPPRYVMTPRDCVPGRGAACAADLHMDEASSFSRTIGPRGKGSDVAPPV